MRIALIGQAAFGERVLRALVETGEEVVVAYMPPEPPGGKASPLREAAEALSIPVRQPARMRDPEVFEDYKTFAPELNVMAFVTDIVPRTILDYPAQGSIQYHPSLLPRHRGASAINWAVINGETKTGLTIFWPDEGLDTGPILLQKEVSIEPDDTVGTVYFNKLFDLGVEAILESIQLIKEGRAPKIVQDLSQGEYEPVCRRMVIDWMYPVGVVYNVIRGCNPSPGAVTTYRGQELKIFDSERRMRSGPEDPGTILEMGPEGFLVAGCGGSILVKRVQPKGAGKLPAAEYAAGVGLRPGDKLGV
jgi:methionyl-tRNA formyltransferase